MAFTKALYYPFINVIDDGWLKTAMLYWEEIQTIVPISMQNPYITPTSQAFHEAGVLMPYYISPEHTLVQKMLADVKKYLNSDAGEALLDFRHALQRKKFFPSIDWKELVRIQENLSYGANSYVDIERYLQFAEIQKLYIHSSKMSLRTLDLLLLRDDSHDGWIRVDEDFANFYMTLLATRISESLGIGLLTDIKGCSKLAHAARLDATLPTQITDGTNKAVPSTLAQGVLFNLAMQGLHIEPDTPVQRILKFREKYAAELGHFRAKIAELSQAISKPGDDSLSFDLLCQNIQDIYLNEVKPSVIFLEDELKSNRIKLMGSDWLSVALVAGSIPLLNSFGVSPQISLLTGAGISLVAHAICYSSEKARTLRENPFSYLLRVKHAFHRPLVAPHGS